MRITIMRATLCNSLLIHRNPRYVFTATRDHEIVEWLERNR